MTNDASELCDASENRTNTVTTNGYRDGTTTNGTVLARKRKVCVVGGGTGGLCAARHLSCYPNLFEFVVLEKTSNVGGTWNYTEKIGHDEHGLPIHTSMYKNMRYDMIN